MSNEIPARSDVRSPGEYIREEMKSRGWTQEDLARILARPLPTINRILNGKHAIMPEMAVALGAAFNMAPEVWMSRESAYRLSLIAAGRDDVSRRARLYELAPLKEMEKRGWIRHAADADSLEAELKRPCKPERSCAARTLRNHFLRVNVHGATGFGR
jgi:HTH-type transcriptional regulator/antitoxin HigA